MVRVKEKSGQQREGREADNQAKEKDNIERKTKKERKGKT